MRESAGRASRIGNPAEAFRAVFTQSCDLSEGDLATFVQLAGTSRRADEHAQRLIAEVVGPATTRLREAGGLRPGITVADIAMFIRMAVTADNRESLAKAIEVLLAGLSRPAGHQAVPSGRS